MKAEVWDEMVDVWGEGSPVMYLYEYLFGLLCKGITRYALIKLVYTSEHFGGKGQDEIYYLCGHINVINLVIYVAYNHQPDGTCLFHDLSLDMLRDWLEDHDKTFYVPEIDYEIKNFAEEVYIAVDINQEKFGEVLVL